MSLFDPKNHFTTRDNEKTLSVELWYPRVEGYPTAIEVGLCDVRAADDLRITYDFDRDGWSINQAQVFAWGEDDTTNCDPLWKEVAFIKAWDSELPCRFTDV